MISGETFGLDFTCNKCLYDAVTLPDLIEASGRSWKTYQEDMPSACYEGSDYGLYAMKHNPFMYFESIRLDSERCSRSVVPFTQLYADITAGQLPNYAFITPNLCNDAHDCGLDVADEWLRSLLLVLQPGLEATGKPYLVILTWDEGQGDHSCCGMPAKAGGRIATVLLSPQARAGFKDETPVYTLLSLEDGRGVVALAVLGTGCGRPTYVDYRALELKRQHCAVSRLSKEDQKRRSVSALIELLQVR